MLFLTVVSLTCALIFKTLPLWLLMLSFNSKKNSAVRTVFTRFDSRGVNTSVVGVFAICQTLVCSCFNPTAKELCSWLLLSNIQCFNIVSSLSNLLSRLLQCSYFFNPKYLDCIGVLSFLWSVHIFRLLRQWEVN